MSTDERSVPPDLFSATPAGARTAGPYQYVAATAGAAPQFGPPAYAYEVPRPPTAKRSGILRRILAWIAVIWGGLTIMFSLIRLFTPVDNGLTTPGAYRFGEVIGFVMAIAMVYGGGQEIASQHLRRIRYLPWLMAVQVALLALAIVAVVTLRPVYPTNVQAAFLGSCEADGGDAARCGCVLNWFESNRSLAQFIADANETATLTSRSDMAAALASCASAH